MKLSHRDALKILGLEWDVDFAAIKLAYHRACSKYHPDRNAAGENMMKLVNSAYQALSDYVASDNAHCADDDINLGDELNGALNAIAGLELNVEICGSWIWVSGDTRPHREILKAAGYRWAPKKLMWSFCGGERTSSRGKFSMDDIRTRHGSVTVKPTIRKSIAA